MTEDGPADSLASLMIMTVGLPLVGAAVIGASGIPGLFVGRRSRAGEWTAVGLHLLGAALVLAGVGAALGGGAGASLRTAWGLPFGSFRIELDGLSVAFLVPLVLVPALGAVYGLGYFGQRDHPATGPKLRVFYGALAGSLVLLAIARDGVLFLLAWEGMALSAFFLVATDDRDKEARDAGWIYLVATHLGTLAIIGCLALVASATGSFALEAMPESSAGIGVATCIFLLALLGFGLKAGMMPLHVWLPGAHAAAPTHVSAVLSGVVLKAGIYGLVRVTGMLPDPPALWGASLLVLGAVSGVLGVAFAIAQHDLKRLLAYHSIENIGIILMGLGLAMLGRSMGRPDWIALGLAGAVLHVWNHAFFKSLLFFSAGAVIQRVHTRDLDRMGGLARAMPVTSVMFLCGAVAICGLPPLNGFVSELLIYLGLLRTIVPGARGSAAGVAFAAPVLALIGALALACFVKVFGAVFLGHPRGLGTDDIHEAPATMIVPMAILGAVCIAIGVAPVGAVPLLDRATAAWCGQAAPAALVELAPLWWVSALGAGAWVLAVGFVVILRRWVRAGTVARAGTWDCGYAAPTSRMQYSSSSFGQMLVALFRWAVRPREDPPALERAFPPPARYSSHAGDVVLDAWVLPAFRRAARGVMRLRALQTGRVQLYILCILITLAAMVLSIVPVLDLLRSVVSR